MNYRCQIVLIYTYICTHNRIVNLSLYWFIRSTLLPNNIISNLKTEQGVLNSISTISISQNKYNDGTKNKKKDGIYTLKFEIKYYSFLTSHLRP